ncbi:hypothetical protein [Desulfofundulus salinus]|uniref:Uncharacterized protein n=1 Tax=Desulfofundulus salinus TaxID=2419843 RepID=A0A494WR77_9FIRM|nr:hypothetical protein [Desulfofundulus salinum]RKO65689.1 hypothetical protein D7024_01035 [Desulfofundulus salinum]
MREGRTGRKKAGPSLRDLWEIKDVRDGVVYLTRNRYRIILRLTPVNFDLLSEGEQHVIENALMAVCQGLDFPVQFLCTAETVDTRAAIAELYSHAAGETSAVRQNYAEVLLSYLDTLMSQRSVLVRRSYAVVGCDGQPYEKARGILEHRAAALAGALSRAKVAAVVLSSDEIVDLLHHLLNRNKVVRPSDLVGAGALDLCVSGKGVITGVQTEKAKANLASEGVLAG